MKVSIVIINYNTPELVYDCLESVSQQVKVDYEVIVVDNNSSQKVDPEKISKFKQAKCFLLDKNLGFGGGNNFGAKKSSGEIYWFLNSDTIIPDDSVNQIFDFMKDNSTIGAVSPILFNDKELKLEQSDYYARFQSLGSILSRTAKPRIRTKESNFFAVDVVVGASLLVRKEIFDQVGGFDEKIFMFFDDDDLCYRIKKAGYKNAIFTGSHIVHLQGKSIKTNWERKKLYYKSQNYFWRKNYGLFPTLLMSAVRFPYVLVKRLRG